MCRNSMIRANNCAVVHIVSTIVAIAVVIARFVVIDIPIVFFVSLLLMILLILRHFPTTAYMQVHSLHSSRFPFICQSGFCCERAHVRRSREKRSSNV